MDKQEISRRKFLGRSSWGLGTAWLSANWAAILAAQEHAHQAVAAMSSSPNAGEDSGTKASFEFLSPEQAREVEAVAAQILPSDSTPGAREAGAVFFIDRALTTFDSDKQKQYTQGLAELQAAVAAMASSPATKFSELPPEKQIAVLKSIEKTDFFDLVRTHTITAFLGPPERGGNRGGVGWKLIEFEDGHVYEPPFGYYDRDYPGWAAGDSTNEKK